MSKSVLDQLREALEDVKNPVLFFILICLGYVALGGLTLFGVYLYTRR